MADVDRDKSGLGRRVLAAAGAGALTPLLAAAAATPANAQPANSADLQRDPQDQMHARHGVIQPVPTVDADWQQVAAALGRPGKVMGGTVYRVGFPRRDLKVVSYGVAIAPGLASGSYVTFTRYVDRRTLLMGDLLRKRAASRHRRAAQPRVGADRDPQAPARPQPRHLVASLPRRVRRPGGACPGVARGAGRHWYAAAQPGDKPLIRGGGGVVARTVVFVCPHGALKSRLRRPISTGSPRRGGRRPRRAWSRRPR